MRLRPVFVLVELALIQTVATIVGLSALPMDAVAKPSIEAERRQLPRPPRRPPPNRTQPGGGLDEEAQSCAPESMPLTALVPVTNPVYTASAHPSFLFYLPDPPEAVAYAEFILLSADEKARIYRTRFNPTQSGIVSISLPEDTHSLEVGENYHWYLNLHCRNIASIPSVNGWVQRADNPEGSGVIAPVIVPNRTNTDLPKIWYDAIAQTAAALATEDTLNTQALENWQKWLSAIGLEQIAQLPLNEIQSSIYSQFPTSTYGAQ